MKPESLISTCVIFTIAGGALLPVIQELDSWHPKAAHLEAPQSDPNRFPATNRCRDGNGVWSNCPSAEAAPPTVPRMALTGVSVGAEQLWVADLGNLCLYSWVDGNTNHVTAVWGQEKRARNEGCSVKEGVRTW